MKGKILFAYFRGFRNAFAPLSRIEDIEILFAENEKDLFEKLSSEKIDILAFSTFINFPPEDLIRKIREKFPDLFILGGGPQATGDPEKTLSLGFSALLLGEAEETFPQFIKEFYWGKRDFKNILGLYPYNKNFPPYVDIDKFFYYSEKLPYFPPLEISRGCPFACRFCATSYLFGGKMRHRSIENILENLNFIVEKGEKIIHFVSPNALAYGGDGRTLEKDALEELLFNLWKFKREKRVKIYFGSFPSEVRPEFVNKETLRLLKKYTDTKSIVIGAQSGSDRMLEKAHRGHTVNDVLNAVKLSRDYGFQVKVDFIFGMPGEEKEDREETWKIIDKIIQMKGKINAHIFMPLPGTFWAREESKISPEDLEKIKKLEKREIVIGNWEKHLQITRKISKK